MSFHRVRVRFGGRVGEAKPGTWPSLSLFALALSRVFSRKGGPRNTEKRKGPRSITWASANGMGIEGEKVAKPFARKMDCLKGSESLLKTSFFQQQTSCKLFCNTLTSETDRWCTLTSMACWSNPRSLEASAASRRAPVCNSAPSGPIKGSKNVTFCWSRLHVAHF